MLCYCQLKKIVDIVTLFTSEQEFVSVWIRFLQKLMGKNHIPIHFLPNQRIVASVKLKFKSLPNAITDRHILWFWKTGSNNYFPIRIPPFYETVLKSAFEN